MRVGLFILAIVMTSGCAAPQLIKSELPFNKTEAEALLRAGSNTIKGSALVRQNSGATVTCAGNQVELVPATKYAEDRLSQIYGNTRRGFRPARGFNVEGADPDYLRLVKTTVCNAQGFFTFSGVADGEFFITTSVLWRTNPYFLDGGVLMHRVTVQGGQEAEIVLAP